MKGIFGMFSVFLISALLFLSCENNGIKLSGRSGSQNDSLFLGFSFGMSRQQFYDYCWEMNSKKLFTHGPGNRSVEYRMERESEETIIMRFYPLFLDEKIYEMPVLFSYEKWAPWNKQYWSEALLQEMLVIFKEWYGEDFQVINHPVQGTVYAKIDGKRRINLFIKDDQYVQAVFTDLKVEKEARKNTEEL